MRKKKPTLPTGTRDFSPTELLKRNYIFDTIRHVFQKYGFLPLETPALEKLSVLVGKYGEEGEKLIFKLLNSGDFLAKIQREEIEKERKEAKALYDAFYEGEGVWARYMAVKQTPNRDSKGIKIDENSYFFGDESEVDGKKIGFLYKDLANVKQKKQGIYEWISDKPRETIEKIRNDRF